MTIASRPSFSETTSDNIKLKNLARSFVEKISPTYNKKNKNNALSFIPEGSTLLLKPKVNNLIYDGDIYSIKQDGAIYLSLNDVINVLDLAVNYNEQEKTGEGWFLKEDWSISFDFNNNSVTSKGNTFKVSDQDIIFEDGLTFVKGESIEQWMGLSFDYDTAQQYVEIKSAYPLPAVAKNARRKRKGSLERSKNEATLPRMEPPHELLDINAADITLGTRYTKQSSGKTINRAYSNIAVQGQVLNHDSYIFATQDSEEGLRTIRTRFSKQSEDPDLLGPLKARYYEFGDISGTEVPLTGDNVSSLGFRVDNNPLTNSNFSITDIEGNSLPDWDVELYRNGVIVGSQIVQDDGRYKFANTPLFAGDNNFEIFFYGPQGEIKSETLSIPVTQSLLNTQKDTYDVSIQLEEERTYQQNQSQDPDKGSPNISARYNKFIGSNLAYLGLRGRSIEGDYKTYASTGVTSVIDGTIYDANFAVDEDLNTALKLAARRRIEEWDVNLSGQWNNDEYTTGNTTDPTILNLSANARKKFTPLIGQLGNINASSNYQQTATGTSLLVNQVGLSNQIDRFNISNIIQHRHQKSSGSSIDDDLENNLSLRGSVGKTYLRAGIDYNILPEAKVDRYYSQINYRHDYRKGADLLLEHRPQNSYTNARLNFNYTNDYFRTTPFIELSSDNNLYAGVNVNFNLVDLPKETLPEMTSQKTIGRGLVTGFVYFDKNGNNIFDADDEKLPEVVVESVNSRKRAQTNENGYATLSGMAVSRPTDIVVDEATLPDSFMVSGFKGASVFPVAGQTHNLTFPIHLAGEIDGTIYIEEANGERQPYANKIIQLISTDNPDQSIIEVQAAFDGFFLFSKVPPGHYMMLPKASTIETNVGNITPQFIEIGYDGTTLFGKKIILKRGYQFVPYNVVYNQETAESNFILQVKKTGKSELSKLLNMLAYNKYGRSILKNFKQIDDLSDDNIEIYAGSQDQLHRACSALTQKKIECSISYVSKTEQI